jgi:hypothetical protein
MIGPYDPRPVDRIARDDARDRFRPQDEQQLASAVRDLARQGLLPGDISRALRLEPRFVWRVLEDAA